LVQRDRLRKAEHVLELAPGELAPMLRAGDGPTAAEAAESRRSRRARRLADAPAYLGPPPSDPPPADWLPPAAARMQRAFFAYLSAMQDEYETSPSKRAPEPSVVRGLPASAGVREGTARLVLTPSDFDRLQPGDILVAQITNPAYNLVLPLLGGVVTDRGGLLSHPAIVTREYGIPGVVGTGDATQRIEDGARVRIDGDAGSVTVLP
ncbi:MAG: PEP-utilizing enzyme, partial [Myxococcota bacterium]